MSIQVVRFPEDGGEPEVLVGDAECDYDPCEKHNRCHCMCPCGMEQNDDCEECADDDDAETGEWVQIGLYNPSQP